MSKKQVILNIPESIYKELDKLSRHRVEKYLTDLIQKITVRPKKTSVAKIFDLFESKKLISFEHDKYLYK